MPMQRLMTLSLASLLALTLLAEDRAAAHPAPFPHRHIYTDESPPRPVQKLRPRHRRPPTRTVIVQQPAPRVSVVEEPAPSVVREPEPEPYQLLGIGVRLSGATAEGEKLGLSDGENGGMVGVGLQLRSRFGRHLGLELSVDALRSEQDDFSQTSVPIMASLTYHLFPESRLQPYALAGAGVHLTRLEYLDGDYVYDFAEVAGQLGAGVELFLTRELSLHADVRGQTIFKNLDSQARIREDCLSQVGDMSGFCDGIHRADPNDKVNIGAQLQVGATFYF